MLYPIPFFNELVMFTINCPVCHFSENDVFSAEERKPSRWTMRVDNSSLLNTRVVRSGSGTIRLPDFGIEIEPGPAAESYISNVEGVLFRTRPVIESAVRFAEEEKQRKRGRKILLMIDKAMSGKMPFTLIIEDPAGVSGIIPDDMRLVKYEELSHEEASQLKGAPLWLDELRSGYVERKG
jgi:zinc finger protein